MFLQKMPQCLLAKPAKLKPIKYRLIVTGEKMKKMLKKALRPEKSFEDWARINNVELNNNEVQNNNIVQNYKNSQMQKKYLIFRNVMTIVIFLVVLTPMLYVINYNTYSNHLTPGEITIPDPPKPPDPPDPPKPITYSSSAVKPLYLSIDEIFNELNVDRRIILFNEDIQNESEAEAYKETIKPSINKNEPTVSYVINNCEYPCVDRGIFIIDFFFRLDPNYLFDNYLKYSNLMLRQSNMKL